MMSGGNCLLVTAAVLSAVAYPASAQFNGWVVGDNGTILHTSDGGATWRPQASGMSDALFGVSFVDTNNGWAVGEPAAILHTSNGGATWSHQTSGTANNLLGVSFVDANNGWAVG